jgi:hypothetical protein
MVRRVDWRVIRPTAGVIDHDQPRAGQPDPLDPTGQEPNDGIDRRKQRELEARGAAVDRQDA